MPVLFLRLLAAATGGAAVYFSFEPHGYWLGAIIGIGLLWFSLLPWSGSPVTVRGACLVGFAHSLVLYLLLLPWIGELVGNMPYVALALSLSLYSIPLGFGAAYLARQPWGFVGFPFFYLAIELLRSSVPFGGFSWVRLAWGQINGPFAGLAQWGSTGLVTLAAVTVAVGLASLLGAKRRLVAAGMVMVPLALAIPATAGLDNADHNVGSVKVAAIQGNVPRLGLDFEGQRRAVLDNHVRETHKAAAQHPEIVIWPENSSDINPFRNPDALAAIHGAVKDVNAPILVGTQTVDEVGARNTMQVFAPGNKVGEHHHKKYLQPFGETMPMREFFRNFTDMVELAGNFKPGDGPGVVNMAGTAVGVATCYEVSFDAAFHTSISNGAQILSTPTNNATFGFSDMTYQQLAMSRMRAIETDRAVVVAATSGVSAIVSPRGEVLNSTKIFVPEHLVANLPLRETVTPAVRYGLVIQAVAVALGVAAVFVAFYRRPRHPVN
ncbi:acyltransferase [Corynebacterium phocae]|uniref:Apolipoprotein N-acyltransferase n=1 Tax=Corynebacterium phocae TaxID=161895 RepID=A0A1L7D316_9CORY|nr:apolipoprotein N-acyltransferase [Corynebacterium phocae]APT92539.1 acyltransferase [Corynebacterium phocae]KAA8725142.1 apolipoprotein N-acyltransferase [Corynebacterium phocae]